MTAARIHRRLASLEKAIGTDAGPRGPAEVLFLNEQGRILWDGSEAMRDWAGRPGGEWPGHWWRLPWPMVVCGGIDPLVVLGLKDNGRA